MMLRLGIETGLLEGRKRKRTGLHVFAYFVETSSMVLINWLFE